jgi:hypothetical protein
VNLDVDRHPDWSKRRGQNAELTVGPFVFWVSTADGLSFGFGVTVLRWTFSWHAEDAR